MSRLWRCHAGSTHFSDLWVHDQNARLRVWEAFEDFVNRYPNSEKVAQSRKNIETLGGTA